MKFRSHWHKSRFSAAPSGRRHEDGRSGMPGVDARVVTGRGKERVSAPATVLFLIAAVATAAPPLPVSPGGANDFVAVGSPCPTFSWSAVDGADGYELVVYEAGDAAASPDGADAAAPEPRLRTRIRGRALSWTPAAAECLELAGAYAWAVRATRDGVGGEWSESRLFEVDVDAVLGEMVPMLKRAIERQLERERLADPASEGVAGAVEAPAQEAYYRDGRRHLGPLPPSPLGVFAEDVELRLEESDSGPGDYVQLVLATPEFDGDPTFGDAWSIVVNANDTASADDGTLFFSTPSFFDALQLFADGSAIVPELRQLTLRTLSSPPFSCTGLQEGNFYWDSSITSLCVCDGSSWAPIDSDNMGSCS